MVEENTRRLVAILAADVADYSRLMHEDEETTIAAWQSARRDIIDPVIAEHGGRIVKHTGDGFLVEFATVTPGLKCAVQLQNELSDGPLNFRMGINLGEIIADKDDIHGDGVNIAARLEGLAEPGGICISGAVYDQVHNKIDLDFVDLGEQQVKNIASPVRVFRVELDGTIRQQPVSHKLWARRWPGYAAAATIIIAIAAGVFILGPWVTQVDPTPADRIANALPDKPSVAVLPFDNMSADKEQDYFADGMVDDLITDLSKVPHLFVIARNSTFTYKGQPVKVQQVAEDLGVRYVVEGSVRRAGGKVRINVQLIDALKGHHLWAERYDGTMADIFDLQDRITGNIVTALAVKLVSGEGETNFSQRGTSNPAAYDAVLLGRRYFRQRGVDPENYVLTKDQFEKALRLDPNYSQAHLSMAALYWWGSLARQDVRLGVAFQEGIDRAKTYLKTAMKNPSALGHRIRMEMYRHEGQFDKAIAEADLAIGLDPNNPEAYRAKAAAQRSAQPALALKNLDIAARLDPKNQSPQWLTRGIANFFLGNNEKAIRNLKLAVAAAPKSDWHYQWLISAYGHLGQTAEAKAAIKKMNDLRQASASGRFTLEFAIGQIKLSKDNKEYFLLGLKNAGVEPGGDLKSTKLALDTILSRSNDGRYKVEGATTITAKQAKALLDQGVAIFDMQGEGSFRAGHLKGAFHSDSKVGNFSEENLVKVVKKNEPICFYCSGFT